MGGIDLILVTDRKDFDRWKTITDELKKEKPLTRGAAVSKFKEVAGPGY